MKYIKKFDTLSAQTEYLNSADIDTYVGYVDENETVYYDDAIPKPLPYEEQYLTFVAEADNLTIGLTSAGDNIFQYSTDSGATWNNLANNGSTSSVNSGQTIIFKASGLTPSSNVGIGTLTPSVNARVQGNIMSLLYGDNFIGQTTIENSDQFSLLFANSNNLTDASKLILPATTLTDRCYYRMFRRCSRLTTAPELPATTLVDSCYYYMFDGCTSLTTAPELPATTLADSCYSWMFAGCSSLATAPELPATTLANYCYTLMFASCTSLTVAPVLSATTLAESCYWQMFQGCTRLNYIKCMATDISATNCTKNWVNGVASTGTFVKAASMNDWTTGREGIPEGWTIENE